MPPVGEVTLELPRERDLGPFVFHQTNVDTWVAQLRRDGIVDVEMSPAAERFWNAVRRSVEVVGF